MLYVAAIFLCIKNAPIHPNISSSLASMLFSIWDLVTPMILLHTSLDSCMCLTAKYWQVGHRHGHFRAESQFSKTAVIITFVFSECTNSNCHFKSLGEEIKKSTDFHFSYLYISSRFYDIF